jgi:xanthine dehydrogenase molybdopterin-binding subunit B
MFSQLQNTCNYSARQAEIASYNAANTWTKRGLSFVPARFNVANYSDPFSAVVVVFSDGTVQISTGGVDVGQGLNTKVAQAAV